MALTICPSCQTQNRPGAKFCRGCGQPLPVPPLPEPVSPYQQPAPRPLSRSASRTKNLWLLGCGFLLVILLLGGGGILLWARLSATLADTPKSEPVAEATRPVTTEASGETTDKSTPTPVTPGFPPTSTPTPGPLIIPGTDIEIPHLSDEEEVEIGREVGRQLEEEYGIYENSRAIPEFKTSQM